ncbi:MAG: hypothetical protein AAF235_07115 [Planctomycetota bacterium]
MSTHATRLFEPLAEMLLLRLTFGLAVLIAVSSVALAQRTAVEPASGDGGDGQTSDSQSGSQQLTGKRGTGFAGDSELGLNRGKPGALDDDDQSTSTGEFPPAEVFFASTPFVVGFQEMTSGLAQADAVGDPGKRLGFRAQILRSTVRVGDVVLIADSPEAAAEAIVWWGMGVRFPVLIDDGSLAAHEDIARFVRAFDPADIVHYAPGDGTRAWPTGEDARQGFIRSALAVSLGAMAQPAGDEESEASALQVVSADTLPPATGDDILSRLTGLGIEPHGLVFVDESDPSWVAGLALAAGRFQPIAFADASGSINDLLSEDDTAALVETVNAATAAIGLDYEDFGDGIDAVTLVMPTGARGQDLMFGKIRELAITDRIARSPGPSFPGGGVFGSRWAWAGLIAGNPARSMYDVMCGLFLPADSATLFDGYGTPTDGFFDEAASGGDPFDMTVAEAELAARGFQTTLYDNGASLKSDWESMARAGLSSDLLLVNSMGMPTSFTVMGEQVGPESVPTFAVPSVVHFVHSFSAKTPGDPKTIAGRFRMHGAYAYVGSMYEPGLQAFVGSSLVADRMSDGWAIGPATRSSFPGTAGFVNMLGDPLITFAPADAFAERLPIASMAGIAIAAGGQTGGTELMSAFDEPVLDEAIRLTARRGDIGQAASLAVFSFEQGNVTPELARAAFTPLTLANKHELAIRALGAMSGSDSTRTAVLDAAWHAAWTYLRSGGASNEDFERILAEHPRSFSADDDVFMLADAAHARGGVDAERTVLETAIPKVKHNSNKAKLQARLDALPPVPEAVGG